MEDAKSFLGKTMAQQRWGTMFISNEITPNSLGAFKSQDFTEAFIHSTKFITSIIILTITGVKYSSPFPFNQRLMTPILLTNSMGSQF